jgi:hypothetical protein
VLISPGGLRNADLVRACADMSAVPWPSLSRRHVGVGQHEALSRWRMIAAPVMTNRGCCAAWNTCVVDVLRSDHAGAAGACVAIALA